MPVILRYYVCRYRFIVLAAAKAAVASSCSNESSIVAVKWQGRRAHKQCIKLCGRQRRWCVLPGSGWGTESVAMNRHVGGIKPVKGIWRVGSTFRRLRLGSVWGQKTSSCPEVSKILQSMTGIKAKTFLAASALLPFL